ncbi:predicted protein [Uncinocarpus reesii 1704]|uniref:Uncharacterized protein n=1 Tax=Uncinocarpus reesii (strain UAMH 1704) TaxID=336963 RepID=C4JDG0_UNCRE|nr:uncharacterized protein UREG_00373 [Uncinocarpus reesii 1704]EEP75527.1 predicted protein [Uncinocarpus reesii 1704]
MVIKSTAFLAACLFGSLTAAAPQKRADATPTVSLWLPQFDIAENDLTFGASVVAAKPTITSYALCPIGFNERICRESAGITVAQGPTSERTKSNANSSAPPAPSVKAPHRLATKGSATSIVTNGVISDPDLMVFYPVPVTAGAEKLQNLPAATTTPTGTGLDSVPTGTDAPTGTGASAPVSTGGMPKLSGSTGWLVGGAAVAIAAIAAL